MYMPSDVCSSMYMYMPSTCYSTNNCIKRRVPAQAYQFEVRKLPAAYSRSAGYGSLMVAECDKIGMKPVCSGPIRWCLDDSNLFLGNKKVLTNPSHRIKYPRAYPSGFGAIQARWDGLCAYANNSQSSGYAMCQVSNTSADWRKPGQSNNPGFVCGRAATAALSSTAPTASPTKAARSVRPTRSAERSVRPTMAPKAPGQTAQPPPIRLGVSLGRLLLGGCALIACVRRL